MSKVSLSRGTDKCAAQRLQDCAEHADTREEGSTIPLASWSAEDYLSRSFRAKEPLLTGLLHQRDMVALGARRRHGKTTLITDIAVGLALPLPNFLGYTIPSARRSLLLI